TRLTGKSDPAGQCRLLGEYPSNAARGRRDIPRVAGQRHPSEWPLALTEQRANIRGHEPRKVERAGSPTQLCLTAQRVPVVEHLCAAIEETNHGRHVLGHRLTGTVLELVRRPCRVNPPPVACHPLPQIRKRVVGGSLVGDDYDLNPTAKTLRKHTGE